jgi:DNA polymerase-3 subunit alpha
MSVKFSKFVHLHNHTEYSFLDGAIKTKDMVAKAVEQGAPAIAITDHGGLFGAMEFYNAAKAGGIKPILGFEAYITSGNRTAKDPVRNHLILLAQNNKGWENLMKLSSIGYTEGFYYKPRIDMEVLEEFSEGLIASSACIAGAVPRAMLKGDRDLAIKLTDDYLRIFGEGNFYYELQNHGMDDEHIAFEQMIDLGQEKGVPFIVTNDAHYLNADDKKAHEVLLCMQTQAKLSDPKRFQFSSDQFYLKPPEEMALLFPDLPEALTNTVDIAERCNVNPNHNAALPSAGIPDDQNEVSDDEMEYMKSICRGALIKAYDDVGRREEELLKLDEKMNKMSFDEPKYLVDLARAGCEKIYGSPLPKAALERMEYELGIIISMQFPGYFLIVRDFMLWSDTQAIMRGCRGSAAGSIVGFALGITNVDPLKFDLIFERFLNPERISMPDVDADFADADRGKVIDYCVNKYGREAVSQIINFGRMKAKAAVKDVARVLEVPVQDSQILSNMVEEGTIAKSIAANGELKTLLETNSLYREVFGYAQKLEGMARQPGMHAGGVIIAPGDIPKWAPIFKQAGKETPTMTQFDMKYVEDTGLIKMDFLGLRTLTVLQNALKSIKRFHDIDIDIWKDIQDKDELTYKEIFHKGNTVEIFQFESPGMRKNLKLLKATSIEDLIAMTSLYRPGPMENIPSFIARKHGNEEIIYPHDMLKDILDVTYGIIIYQEQVMRIAQKMGQFTLGMADLLRKAMGKKKLDVMEKMKDNFMTGARNQDVDDKSAEAVWALMAKFAEYGFNKAHACVYAHVSYQAAYLKAHYPAEYMAAVMTSRMGDNEQFVVATEEAKRCGITVLAPNVNKSRVNCDVFEGEIAIGLGAIANVGKAGPEIEKIQDEREEPFIDIFDLCSSVNLKNVSKKALESLIYAGALDSLKGNRAQNLAAIESAVDFAKKEQKEIELGQTSLFGGDSAVDIPKPTLPEAEEWDHFDKLNYEKEVLNFYVSGHPLEAYKDEVEGFSTFNFSNESVAKVKNPPAGKFGRRGGDGKSVVVGGVITNVRKVFTKKTGEPMAFMKFEDLHGSGELLCWPKTYKEYGEFCIDEQMVLVRGKVEKEVEHGQDGEGGKVIGKVIIDKMIPLETTRNDLTKSVHISISTTGLEEEHINQIKKVCDDNKGGCSVIIKLMTDDENEYKIKSKGLRISPSVATFKALKELTGVDDVGLSQREH